jgi:hypothetical protein
MELIHHLPALPFYIRTITLYIYININIQILPLYKPLRVLIHKIDLFLLFQVFFFFLFQLCNFIIFSARWLYLQQFWHQWHIWAFTKCLMV